MNFDAEDYLRIAHKLSGKQPDKEPGVDALLRSAISRAYYEALLTAVKYIKVMTPGINIPQYDTHSYVQDKLKEAGGRLLTIAENLRTMRKKRNDADYDQPLNNLPRDTQAVFLQSHQVISSLTDLLSKQRK